MSALDTRAQLYAGVCENPGDDSLRLAWADWLEEHGDRPGDRDRAALIKHHHAMALLGPGPICTCTWGGARQACREGCPFDAWGRSGGAAYYDHEERAAEIVGRHPEWGVVACPRCLSWGGARRATGFCIACSGTRDLLTRTRRAVHDDRLDEFLKPVYRMGYPSAVPCTLRDVAFMDTTSCRCRRPGGCAVCDGRGYVAAPAEPTTWAETVVRTLPVESFPMTDRTPGNGGDLQWDDADRPSDFYTGWWWAPHHPEDPPERDRAWWLPRELFDFFRRQYVRNVSVHGYLRFDTVREANDALATSACLWVREVAYEKES